MSYVCRKEQYSYTTVTAVGSVSLALRLMMSSTTNCATESDYAVLCSREPNCYSFLRMPSATGFTNTSFRRRGVVCYDDHQLR